MGLYAVYSRDTKSYEDLIAEFKRLKSVLEALAQERAKIPSQILGRDINSFIIDDLIVYFDGISRGSEEPCTARVHIQTRENGRTYAEEDLQKTGLCSRLAGEGYRRI